MLFTARVFDRERGLDHTSGFIEETRLHSGMAVSDAIQREGLTLVHWLAVVLAALTGLVHLLLGLGSLPDPLGVAALLAAGGYAGAIVLFLLGWRRRLLYLIGIPYTASQIVLWYVINEPAGIGDVTAIEAFDKLVQGLLIVVLVALIVRQPEAE